MTLRGRQLHMRSAEPSRKREKQEERGKQKKSQSAVELLIKLKISNRSTFESISNYTYLFTGII